MKQETKEIVDWIKKQINLAKENCIDVAWNGNYEYYNTDYKKAIKFLNSLPQIESRLCKGGYIQDKNGTPCCHGDKVIYDENYEGILEWDKKNARFIIASIYGDYDFTKIKSFVKMN